MTSWAPAPNPCLCAATRRLLLQAAGIGLDCGWLFVLKPQIVNYLKHGSCQEKHFMSVALDAYFNFSLTCKVFLYNSDLPFQTDSVLQQKRSCKANVKLSFHSDRP